MAYLSLWADWWAGSLDPSRAVIGLPLYAWNRIGQILQFFGAFFLIGEIIGVPRLAKAASDLRMVAARPRQGVDRLVKQIRSPVDILVDAFWALIGGLGVRESQQRRAERKARLDRSAWPGWFAAMSVAATATVWIVIGLPGGLLPQAVLALFIFVVIAALVLPLLALAVFLLGNLSVLITVGGLRFLVWTIDRIGKSELSKAVSFSLVAIGSLLIFLTS